MYSEELMKFKAFTDSSIKLSQCFDNNDIDQDGTQIIRESDHNLLICYFNIKVISQIENKRQEIFNFKNIDHQMKFKALTDSSTKLSQCFDNNDSIHKQVEAWNKKLNLFLQKSFRKIRISRQNFNSNK